MTEHVYRKFPDHIKAIKGLLQNDATFREICNDYEEISSWLANYCCSEGKSSNACHDAWELLKMLEGEIIEALAVDKK